MPAGQHFGMTGLAGARAAENEAGGIHPAAPARLFGRKENAPAGGSLAKTDDS